jgi:hypothetical protein
MTTQLQYLLKDFHGSVASQTNEVLRQAAASEHPDHWLVWWTDPELTGPRQEEVNMVFYTTVRYTVLAPGVKIDGKVSGLRYCAPLGDIRLAIKERGKC